MVVQSASITWLLGVVLLLWEHNKLDWVQPCLSDGRPVLRMLLNEMEKNKDVKQFRLLPLFSAVCKPMSLNTVTLKAMLAGRYKL